MSSSESIAGISTEKPLKEDLHYNSHLENLIASEAEKALVFRWLHDQSEKRYSQMNAFIAIPVICISTLAGTASIGQESLFGSGQAAPVAIGMMSLTVSILNVISNFFGWAKRTEGHRISGINYAKLHRWISIELALPRDQRMPAKHFLKQIREQIDRLNETSPPIPQIVVDRFRTNMKHIKDDVSLPEICNEIHCVEVYRGKNTEGEIEPSVNAVVSSKDIVVQIVPQETSSTPLLGSEASQTK